MPKPVSAPLHPRLGGVGLRTRLPAWHRVWALTVIAGACGAVTLGAQAQAPTNSPIPIPLEEGAKRQPTLEREREQAAGPGHSFVVYRWEGPMEPLVRFYIQHLGGDRDADLDTASVRPGGTSGISYHLGFWTLADSCADSAAPPAAGDTTPCKHWQRAKDLKRMLNRRLPLAPGAWVQHAIFTWYSRDEQGALTKWTADLFDSGIAPDWRSYGMSAELIIESKQLKGGAPKG